MAHFIHPLTPYEERLIHSWLTDCEEGSLAYKRLQTVVLSQQRLKTSEIAGRLDLFPETVLNWVKSFNAYGLTWLENSLADQNSLENVIRDKVFVHPLTAETQAAIADLQSCYAEYPPMLKRLQVLQLSNAGITAYQIARALNLAPSTVRQWIKRFNEEGLASLETVTDRKWLAARH